MKNTISAVKFSRYFALLLILGSVFFSTSTALPEEGPRLSLANCQAKPIQGVWYLDHPGGSYNHMAVDRDLDRIKYGLCANYIALQATIYQEDKYSSDPKIDSRTVSDETLADIVRKIQDRGMKVVLVITLKSDDGTWEGAIHPTSLDSWFDHWQDIATHYGRFSERHGIDVFLIGSELTTLRDKPERWNSIIESTREVFSGEVSFSVNFWTDRDQYEEVLNMTQWDNLDYIGITGYFELTSSNNPTVTQLTEAWSSDRHGQNVLEDLKGLRDKYEKPVVFWEIGYQSKEGTNIRPWDYSTHAPLDQKEQRDCWVGFLQATHDKDWIQGFVAFAEQVGLPRDDPGYHGYNVLRKQAETVFCHICN